MIRGFMRTTSRTALLAAAGLFMGSFAVTPAQAADLGNSNCCADLEERVAELEATTARKGNRVVSLQVYGQVNKALLIWDDGVDSDAFVVDNDFAGGRLGFTGKATIKPGWTAGYLIEFDYQDSASDKVDNENDKSGTTGSDSDELNPSEIVIRYNNWYIEGERFGRITVGQASPAADGAHQVVLGNSLRNGGVDHATSFTLRLADGGGFSDTTLGNVASDLDVGRDDVIRYDSPSIYGFIVSTSWGDNDYWDVALRFKKEWNSIRIAGAVAYVWDGTEDTALSTLTGLIAEGESSFEQFGGSISIQHIPTGIYGAFAAAEREYQDIDLESSFWYVQLGIEKKWLPYGTTTVYGEFGAYNDMDDFTDDGEAAGDVERWGFGVVQKVDAAALEIYAQATFWTFDDLTEEGEEIEPIEDITTLMVGSRLKF